MNLDLGVDLKSAGGPSRTAKDQACDLSGQILSLAKE